jgi:hypothetical protein
MTRTCAGCGKEFETKYPTKVYCNMGCRIDAKARKLLEKPHSGTYIKDFMEQGKMIGHARKMIQEGYARVDILKSIASTFEVSISLSENYYQEAKRRVEIIEGVRV